MVSKSTAVKLGVVVIAGVFNLVPSIASAADCKPADKFSTLEPGVLKVTSAVVPPYIVQAEDGKTAAGIDAFVMEAFAKANCLEVQHQFTDSAAAIQYVVAGRSDVAVGAWYRTAERAKVLGVSAPVYLEQTAIYSREGLTQFSQLKGRKVGTVQGYLWVPELKKMYGSDLNLYPTAVALAQDLSSGRISAAVNTYSIGVETQKQGGMPKDIQVKVATPDPAVKSSIEPAQTAYLYKKGNQELGQAMDRLIKELQDNGSLGKELQKAGLDASAATPGTPRYADQ
ncbi:amino acid ABC transporter substrate-binding protein [Pseudomonas sp. CFBP 8758]|uniref:substrate-binding periplasmic protein n=1 Tax=Pseudomonas sp. CFBP 8758 TaxID=2775286 RepID=UPI00177C9BD7|nr:transporter substrate-binding domain-containing protein [Pseudomonas sp. CFBP 8758]MBD8593032.1 amino acid ABC transporter substrate-binding protein [Pseudomonas sp. CFBP 8758]